MREQFKELHLLIQSKNKISPTFHVQKVQKTTFYKFLRELVMEYKEININKWTLNKDDILNILRIYRIYSRINR